jgi:CRISPR/Cas system CSM-associated protein Csm3 (group 7 of RAMP superfamily)
MHLEMRVAWIVATPLNIAGAPADNPLVDTPLLRRYHATGDAEILLPASTIKGKLRGEAERLLRTFEVGGMLCQGRTPETICPAFWWDKVTTPPDDMCFLCRLFGAPWHPCSLSFSDVTPRDIRGDDTVVRPGVGLSRVRGTAQEDLLFFAETTPALADGVTFANGHIRGEIPEERAIALLWAAVQCVVAFGNGRSRGRGWLQARTVRLCVDGTVWDEARVAEIWRDWLGIQGAGSDCGS